MISNRFPITSRLPIFRLESVNQFVLCDWSFTSETKAHNANATVIDYSAGSDTRTRFSKILALPFIKSIEVSNRFPITSRLPIFRLESINQFVLFDWTFTSETKTHSTSANLFDLCSGSDIRTRFSKIVSIPFAKPIEITTFSITTRFPLFTITAPAEEFYSSDGIESAETSLLRSYTELIELVSPIDIAYNHIRLIDSIDAFDVLSAMSKIQLDAITTSEIRISPQLFTKIDNSQLVDQRFSFSIQIYDLSSLFDQLKSKSMFNYEYAYFEDLISVLPTAFTFVDDYGSTIDILTTLLRKIPDSLYATEFVSETIRSFIDSSAVLDRVKLFERASIDILETFEVIELVRFVFDELIADSSIIEISSQTSLIDSIITYDYLGNVQFFRNDTLYLFLERGIVTATFFDFDYVHPSEYFIESFMLVIDLMQSQDYSFDRSIELYEYSILEYEISGIFLGDVEFVECIDLSFVILFVNAVAYAIEDYVSRMIELIDYSALDSYIETMLRIQLDDILAFDGFRFDIEEYSVVVSGIAPRFVVVQYAYPLQNIKLAFSTESINEIHHGIVENPGDIAYEQDREVLTSIIDTSERIHRSVRSDGTIRKIDAPSGEYVVQGIVAERYDKVFAKFKPVFIANFVDVPLTIGDEDSAPYRYDRDKIELDDSSVVYIVSIDNVIFFEIEELTCQS